MRSITSGQNYGQQIELSRPWSCRVLFHFCQVSIQLWMHKIDTNRLKHHTCPTILQLWLCVHCVCMSTDTFVYAAHTNCAHISAQCRVSSLLCMSVLMLSVAVARCTFGAFAKIDELFLAFSLAADAKYSHTQKMCNDVVVEPELEKTLRNCIVFVCVNRRCRRRRVCREESCVCVCFGTLCGKLFVFPHRTTPHAASCHFCR